MNPLQRYNKSLAAAEIVPDPAQEKVVAYLQTLHQRLSTAPHAKRGLFSRLGGRNAPSPVKGLYLWGGVGRGKTHLVDMFYQCLPFAKKKRSHFHRFMRKTHMELKQLRANEDPLALIGERFAGEFRVLCFDEFIVNDIADAMILGRLLERLFGNGVTLVATSNIQPDDLYRDGLQRDRFQPAIDLIKSHTEVIHLDSGTDYRQQYLNQANIYFHPHNQDTHDNLWRNFSHVAPESANPDVTLEVDGRDIRSVFYADGVVWFEFAEICGGPRSQNDYIELARCFHTIVVSDIPRLDQDSDDQARRLINLIDILYDRNVKFMGSGCCAPDQLYRGDRLRDEFKRTASRLVEMQSHDYLAKKHLP